MNKIHQFADLVAQLRFNCHGVRKAKNDEDVYILSTFIRHDIERHEQKGAITHEQAEELCMFLRVLSKHRLHELEELGLA